MQDSRVTFITTTTYGSWLPGDVRGYVQDGRILPATPALERHAKSLMRRPAVHFSDAERNWLLDACLATCVEFGYRLYDLAIEEWHVHWILQHHDAVESMVGRMKTRMRQRLGRGRIWTDGFYQSELRTDEELLMARRYIREHPGCRVSDGRQLPVGPSKAS
jgi:hypothetical protein